MKPDLRPISVLTVEILQSSEWWMVVAMARAFGFPSRDCLRVLGLGFINIENALCYPCKAEAPFDPLPWPKLDDEEVIESLSEFAQIHGDAIQLVRMVNTNFSVGWYLAVFTADDEINHASEDVSRDGYHPAPRQGGKWVWEKDI